MCFLSLHFKQDWFTYLVQNIILKTVLSVQVRGREQGGGKEDQEYLQHCCKASWHPAIARVKRLWLLCPFRNIFTFKKDNKRPSNQNRQKRVHWKCSPERWLCRHRAKSFHPWPSDSGICPPLLLSFSHCVLRSAGDVENDDRWTINNELQTTILSTKSSLHFWVLLWRNSKFLSRVASYLTSTVHKH